MKATVTRRRKNNKKYTLILSIAIVLAAVAFVRGVQLQAKAAEYEKQVNAMREKLEKEKQRTTDLEEYKTYVQTKEFVEQYAKEKLGLIYEDEIIFEGQ